MPQDHLSMLFSKWMSRKREKSLHQVWECTLCCLDILALEIWVSSIRRLLTVGSYFFLPWQGNTIAGTTDSPCKISHNPIAEEQEINWILNEVRRYLTPDINLRRSDVLAAWPGMYMAL